MLSTNVFFTVLFSLMFLFVLIVGITSGDFSLVLWDLWLVPFLILFFSELKKSFKKEKEKSAARRKGKVLYGYIVGFESQHVKYNGHEQLDARVLLSEPTYANRIVTCDIGSNIEKYQAGDYVELKANQTNGVIGHKIFESDVPTEALLHFQNYARYNESTLNSTPLHSKKPSYAGTNPNTADKIAAFAFKLMFAAITVGLSIMGIANIVVGAFMPHIGLILYGLVVLFIASICGNLLQKLIYADRQGE